MSFFQKVKNFPFNLIVPISNWGTDHVTTALNLAALNSPAAKALGFARILNLFLSPIISGKFRHFFGSHFAKMAAFQDACSL